LDLQPKGNPNAKSSGTGSNRSLVGGGAEVSQEQLMQIIEESRITAAAEEAARQEAGKEG
jgi:hypothetical protein